MSSLAIQTVPGRAPSAELRLVAGRRESVRNDLRLLGALFIALQILDGALTFHGVSLHGTAVEGNHLIRFLMNEIGISSALVVVKSLAVMCVLIVCIAGIKFRWVRPAMISLIGIYAALAILPWGILFFLSV